LALLEDVERARAELHSDPAVQGLRDRNARESIEMLRGVVAKNRPLTFDREVEGLDEGLRG
jgi:hypothetical protein